ncbi:RICIN domain-containing protein [Streptomyces antimycoticus]
MSSASGRCLDVNGAGTSNRTAVILWACDGQSNQKWSTPIPPPGSGGSGPCDMYSRKGDIRVADRRTLRACRPVPHPKGRTW